MREIRKWMFAILAVALILSLCFSFVACKRGDNENETNTGSTEVDDTVTDDTGSDDTVTDDTSSDDTVTDDTSSDDTDTEDTAADTDEDSTESDSTDVTDSTGEDTDSKVEKQEILLDDLTENVRMLNSRDRAVYGEMSCEFIGSGIAFRLDNAGGDVVINCTLSKEAPVTFLVKVDGKPFNINGKPYIVVSEWGDITISDIPTGVHDIEIIKVSGYAQSQALFHEMSFYGTLLEQDAPASKDLKIEILDESFMNVGVTDGNDNKGVDALLSYFALFDSYDAEVSLLDFGDAGLLGKSNTVVDRYLLRSPDRSLDAYDFSDSADLVIVNIGATDFNASASPAANADTFMKKYRNLLELIRTKNGLNTPIVCLYSAGEGYGPQIKSVCDTMGSGVYALEIPTDYIEDGVLTASEVENHKQELLVKLDNILENVGKVPELSGKESGSGIKVDFSEFS